MSKKVSSPLHFGFFFLAKREKKLAILAFFSTLFFCLLSCLRSSYCLQGRKRSLSLSLCVSLVLAHKKCQMKLSGGEAAAEAPRSPRLLRLRPRRSRPPPLPLPLPLQQEQQLEQRALLPGAGAHWDHSHSCSPKLPRCRWGPWSGRRGGGGGGRSSCPAAPPRR